MKKLKEIQLNFKIALFLFLILNLFLNYELFNPIDHPPVLDILNYIIFGQVLSFLLIGYFERKPRISSLTMNILDIGVISGLILISSLESGRNMESWYIAIGWLFLIKPYAMGTILFCIIVTTNFDLYSLIKGNKNSRDRKFYFSIIVWISVLTWSYSNWNLLGFSLCLFLFLSLFVFYLVKNWKMDKMRETKVQSCEYTFTNKRKLQLKGVFFVSYIILYYGLSGIYPLFRLTVLMFLPLSALIIVNQSSIFSKSQRESRKKIKRTTVFLLAIFPFLIAFTYGLPQIRFLPRFTFFVLLGGLITKAFKVEKKRQIKKLGYAIGLFFIHFVIVFWDSFNHGYNYSDSTYNNIWPYVYLGSPIHGMIGGSIIYLLTTGIFNLLYPSFGPLTQKSTINSRMFWNGFWFLGAMSAGFMVLLPNFNIVTFGGGVSKGIPKPGDLYYTITVAGFSVFGGILLFSALLIFLINKNLKALKQSTNNEKNIQKNQEILTSRNFFEIFSSKILKDLPQKLRENKKTILITILILMPLGFVQGWSHVEANQRPIVSYQPGKHVIWIQNNSEHITNEKIVPRGPPKKECDYQIYMAQNEYEAFQLVVNPLKSYLNDLEFEVSDLKNQENSSKFIPNDQIDIRYATPMLSSEFYDKLDALEKNEHLSPDRNHVFWINLRTDNVSAGDYSGEIKLNYNRLNGFQAKINLQIHVWNFSIPVIRHTRTSVGGQTFDEEIQKHYYSHRLNTYGVSIERISDYNISDWTGYACWFNETDFTWVFNWTWWDQQTEDNIKNGENAFRVRCPLGFSDNPENWKTERWYNGTLNYYQEVNAHFVEKGWDDEAFFYDIDEPQYHLPKGLTLKQYFDKLALVLRDIKQVAPELKISITYAPTEEARSAFPYIDIWIPLNSQFDLKAIEERKQAGDEVWFYTCVQPVAPYPNTMFFNHLFETRLLMWQVYKYNLDGYLFWRSWSYRHYGYGIGFNGLGDGVLLYKDLDGSTIESVRWEMLLQGQEDYEYLWLFDKLCDNFKERGEINQISSMKTDIESKMNQLITNHKKFSRDPKDLYALRMKIGTYINVLNSKL